MLLSTSLIISSLLSGFALESRPVEVYPSLTYSIRRHMEDEIYSENIQVSWPGGNTNNRKGISTWDFSHLSKDQLAAISSVELNMTLWSTFGSNESKRIRIFAVSLPATTDDSQSSLITQRSWRELAADGWHGMRSNTNFPSSAQLSPQLVGEIEISVSKEIQPQIIELPDLAQFIRNRVASSATRWLGLGFASDQLNDNYLIAREGQGEGISITLR